MAQKAQRQQGVYRDSYDLHCRWLPRVSCQF